MLDRINLGGLIRAHFGTLKSYRTKKHRLGDIGLYVGLPSAVAVLLLIFAVSIVPIANMIVTTVSIFAGLLFSLLVLIYQSSQASHEPGRMEDIRRELLKHAFANTAFAILIAIPTVLVTLFASAASPAPPAPGVTTASPSIIALTATAVAVFLFGVFILTLLMILRRVGALIRTDMEGPRASPRSVGDSRRAAG